MPTPKTPDNSRKIIDVSHPDSSASDTSSKPVLITNRPIMKDPMVVDDTNKKQTEDKGLPKTPKEANIEPLSAPILPIEIVDASDKNDKSKVEEKTPEQNETPDESNPDEISLKPDPPFEEPNTIEPIVEQSKDKEAEPEVKPEAKSEPEPEPEPAPEPELEPETEAETKSEKPAEEKVKESDIKKDVSSDSKSDESEPNSDTSDEKSAEEIDSQEAEKLAKHDAEIEKLIESKKYNLPINSVEKRRSRRFVLLGVILSLVLLFAWADIALDAGLVNVSSSIPHTHLFSTSSQSNTSVVAPSVTPKAPDTSANSKTKEQLSEVQTLLEAYFTTNSYYPSDLSPSPLINQAGVTGVTADTLNAPTGTKFIYTAYPSGCSTASKNCLRYNLKATTTGGKLIDSLHSIN